MGLVTLNLWQLALKINGSLCFITILQKLISQPYFLDQVKNRFSKQRRQLGHFTGGLYLSIFNYQLCEDQTAFSPFITHISCREFLLMTGKFKKRKKKTIRNSSKKVCQFIRVSYTNRTTLTELHIWGFGKVFSPPPHLTPNGI